MDRLYQYIQLTRLDKPIGIYLVLWPMLWSLWFAAQGFPALDILLIFVTGTVVMRSAGCAINDFADRKIDKHVARTRDRPLTAGRISSKEALAVFVILVLISFLLVLQLNLLTMMLSVPAVILAASYPFSKRFTSLPQAWLGVAFASAVPMAFAAVLDTLPIGLWLIFAATTAWALSYDTMYAMTDREDDLKIGVKSTAILFGNLDRYIVGLFQLLVVILMWFAGETFNAGTIYFNGLIGTSIIFFTYQQWLIYRREPQRCFRAFLNNHYYGMSLFIIMVLDFYYR